MSLTYYTQTVSVPLFMCVIDKNINAFEKSSQCAINAANIIRKINNDIRENQHIWHWQNTWADVVQKEQRRLLLKEAEHTFYDCYSERKKHAHNIHILKWWIRERFPYNMSYLSKDEIEQIYSYLEYNTYA